MRWEARDGTEMVLYWFEKNEKMNRSPSRKEGPPFTRASDTVLGSKRRLRLEKTRLERGWGCLSERQRRAIVEIESSDSMRGIMQWGHRKISLVPKALFHVSINWAQFTAGRIKCLEKAIGRERRRRKLASSEETAAVSH